MHRSIGTTFARGATWLPPLALALGVAPAAPRAQALGSHAKAQASANLVFGSTHQQLVAAQGDLARADSALDIAGSVRFHYGEATDADGVRSVNARGWMASLTLDARPFATVSPFVFGSIESSFETRLAHRESGGVGAKWSVLHTPKVRGSVSLAVLGEHARSLGPSSATSPRDASVARWSARVKVSRDAGDGVSASHTMFFQPRIDDTSRYLVSSATQLAYALTNAIGVTLSFVDNYDTEARSRGARANNDGQLLFGLAIAR